MAAEHATRVVIVGGGECAARAAAVLRERGFAGPVVVIGEEAAPPYERPPLSKAALTDDEPAAVTVLSAAHAAERAIELRLGDRVEMVDPTASEVELSDGTRIGYDRLLLATGARARQLPVPGGERAASLRSLADATHLRTRLVSGASVVVIGAGFIGLEVAAAARRRGCRVTVIEALGRAMGRGVPDSVADVLVKRHIAEQVDLRFDTAVQAIEAHGDMSVVHVGSGGETLVADVVLAGVGAIPNTELAERAGLALDNGIAVDSALRTSDPAVWAAGDCCSMPHALYGDTRLRFESWRMARDQATVAAATMMGTDEICHSVPWFWSDQYDLTLQIVGLPGFAVDEVVRSNSDGTWVHFGRDSQGRLVSASTVAGPGNMGVFKSIKAAERLIAAGATPSPSVLADPGINLRSLL